MTDADIGRIKWRCRRGMRELDILLSAFADDRYKTLAPPDRAAFERLLDAADSDLYRWLMGRDLPVEPSLKRIVEMVSGLN
jgi:antitoxin CptB